MPSSAEGGFDFDEVWVAAYGRPPLAEERKAYALARASYFEGFYTAIRLAHELQQSFIDDINKRLAALTEQVGALTGGDYVREQAQKEESSDGGTQRAPEGGGDPSQRRAEDTTPGAEF